MNWKTYFQTYFSERWIYRNVIKLSKEYKGAVAVHDVGSTYFHLHSKPFKFNPSENIELVINSIHI